MTFEFTRDDRTVMFRFLNVDQRLAYSEMKVDEKFSAKEYTFEIDDEIIADGFEAVCFDPVGVESLLFRGSDVFQIEGGAFR